MSCLWIVSAVSLYATWLNANRNAACFGLWFVTNSIWAVVDAADGQWPRLVLDLAYVGLALLGAWRWTRS